MIHNISKFIAALALLATAQTAWAWDGSGTAESPYQIKSTADLDQLATDVNSGTTYANKYFVLTTDLTYDPDVLTIDNDNDGTNESNYTAIGFYKSGYKRFSGHFDGQNHTISGIRIYKGGDADADKYQGIFAVIANVAEVKNVFLANTSITGSSNCGGIIGRNEGTVSNCHVLSTVTVHGVYYPAYNHGGIVGINRGTVTGCTSAASVTGTSSSLYNGGIAGGNEGTVSDCIYLGNTIEGSKRVGAIVGDNSATVRNCYYISTTFQGKENHGYTLANDASATGYNTTSATVTDVRLATSDDFAVSGDTYTIGTAAGWSVMCAALCHNDTYNRFSGKTVRLGADITVTRMAGGENHEFTGTFDGGGHTLTVSISSSDGNAAPFREIMGATIRNLKVSGTVSGHKHSAGLVSYARGADSSVENTIENCLVATDVSTIVDTDGDCYLGGIVGHGFNCKLTIRGCAFTGSLTSPHNYTGGLQGWSDGNTLILEDDIFAASSVNAANVGFHPIAIHVNNASTTATVTNVYYTEAPTCTTASRIAAAGMQAHTVTAGENVTLALSGTATEYGVSGITVYESNHGIKFGTTYYAGSDDQLSLTLTTSAQCDQPGYQYGYTASAGTLSGTTLTMPDQDVTISVNTAALAPIDWATVNQGNSADDPYMIYNKDQLLLLAHRVNGTHGETANDYYGMYFKLGADITFSHDAVESDDYDENYEAIGGYIGGTNRYFKGDFDGDGHTVSGIRIRKTGSGNADNYQGLFGCISSGADIHDVHLTDARITGYQSVGGIVGAISVPLNGSGVTVSGCSVTDSYITATSSSYGIICGSNTRGYSNGTLRNNYYHGCTVNGTAVTSGKGCGSGNKVSGFSIADITANHGALPAYHLDLGANITTPPGTFAGQTEWLDTPPVDARLAPENGFTLAGNHYFASGYVFTPGSTLASGAAQGYTPRAILGGQLLDPYTPTGDDDPLAGKAIARLTITADCDGKTLASTQAIYSTRQPVTVAYINADGTPGEASAIALDGTETTLAAGWYFVGKDISYTQTLTLTGDVTLILKDGCTMNVGESGSEVDGYGINCYDEANNTYYDLTICGQTAQTGTLSVYTTGQYHYAIGTRHITVNGGNVIAHTDGSGCGIDTKRSGNVTINRGSVSATTTDTGSWAWAINATGNLTINGGNVSAKSNSQAIQADGNVAINGGTVNATGGDGGYSGIYSNGTIEINGGNVTASSIYAYADDGTALTLGWTRPADRITASSISTGGGTVAVADGKALTDGSGNIYTGTLTASELSAFAAETTLQPCLALADAADNTAAITDHAGLTLAVALSGRTLYKDGSWNTLCLPFAVDLTASGTLSGDNVQAMTLNTSSSTFADGTLTLNFTAVTEPIPAGTPFIIKWDKPANYEPYTGQNAATCSDLVSPVFMGVTIDAENRDATVTGVLTFTGTYAPVPIPAAGDNTKLYLGAANKLYYPTKSMTIGTHRAYFQLLGDLTAGNPTSPQSSHVRAFVLNFGDDEPTSVTTPLALWRGAGGEAWYTLDGRRLDGQPTAKGLYIHGGKKVAIK